MSVTSVPRANMCMALIAREGVIAHEGVDLS
jgi:hypothetical protein